MSDTAAVPEHDAVVLYRARPDLPEHESVIHRDIALRIADLMDVPFDGVFDAARHAGKRCYFVPTDTIVGTSLRAELGIESERDLFGGCTEHAFMPTKAITHGLFGTDAQCPEGWSNAFSERVVNATLPGFTAFSVNDARKAAERLLSEGGTLRLKPVHATAGRGQVLIEHAGKLDAAFAGQDASALRECGLVLETHLDDVTTYSVGQARVAGLIASYIGTQRLTRDNAGEQVYGGSRLRFTRGDYAALLDLPLDDECRRAVDLARRYDAAADACYPGFFASRRNYDVAAGIDAKGRRLMGVLEQSWRIGGASRAEIAALEVFAADPACRCLWAETLELFGPDAAAPPHAIETYAGEDPDLGLIRKYVMVEAYGNKQ